jgi:integrase/recombinase XerD
LNPGPELDRLADKEKQIVDKNTLPTYLSLCEIQGICNEWLTTIKRFLTHYLEDVQWTITQSTTLQYLKSVLKKYSISYYRKQSYQIRKFLTYLEIEWAKDIRLPAEIETPPKRIMLEDIHRTIKHFEQHRFLKQIKAVILLGATSGIRAEELYQLTIDDIDIGNSVVYIRHNPSNGQSTKTKKSRISFFNKEAERALEEYIEFYNGNNVLKCLFNQSHITRLFRDAPIKVKDLRKFFSQEWDRRGGPTSIKKILMGHSLRNDVDLMHYNAQSEEDLKAIYDRVMREDVFI